MNNRQIVVAAKKYAAEKKWSAIQIHCTRGTFHVTNACEYWVTAKEILQAATGLEFQHMNSGMARLKVNN